jgi:predicted acylesterase/phospholipase RssA/CRP-like cAMP-binding protein
MLLHNLMAGGCHTAAARGAAYGKRIPVHRVMPMQPSSTPIPDLEEVIHRSPLLDGLSEEAVSALGAAMQEVAVQAGDALFGSRAAGDALYLVLGGEVHAMESNAAGEDQIVRVIRPGELVDEMQVVAGSTRMVDLEAAVETRLARIPGAVVDRITAAHSDLRAARERLHRRQLLCRLHPVFGTFDRQLLDDVEATADWEHLGRGELLFEQETLREGLFFVISGRVKVLRYERDGSVRVLGEAGRGESTGEMVFFGGGRHRERVQAVRDTVLVGFTNEEFDLLAARRPKILRRVAHNLVERLHRGVRPLGRVTNVAVVPCAPRPVVQEFTDRLVAALSAIGPVLRLGAEIVDQRLAEPGIAQTWGPSPETTRLLAWLEAQEAAHRFIVYEAEAKPTAWTRRCVRQADRVLLVAQAAADPRPTELERTLHGLEGRITDSHEVLVLLHPDGGCLPTGTRHWLRPRPYVEEHFHLRWDRKADFARLARTLAGLAVGLVLGGGAARALAHIGILLAMDEARLPIDMIGGTSMGASIAAQRAMGWSPREIRDVNHRVWVEIRPHRRLTLPLFSVIGNRESERCGRMMYGDTQIEDLWIPFYCVSSNLTTAERVVHRRGSLLWAATASASIPGAAMPVLNNGHLLVDGALLDNVPTEVMRDLGCGTVFASEVSVEEDAAFTSDRIPTPWEALHGRLSPRRARVRFPSLLEVAMRASMLHSIYRQKTALLDADFVFRPPIDEFGLMDFTRLDEAMAVGYEHAREAVLGWEAAGRLAALRESLGLPSGPRGSAPRTVEPTPA